MSLTREGRRRLIANARRNGLGTPGFRRHRPDWILYRVPMVHDGKPIDAVVAAERFAGEWWAPFAHYAGASRRLHCFERPPDSMREELARARR